MVAAALLIGAGLALRSVIAERMQPSPAANPSPLPPGTFRLRAEQLAGIKTEAVREMTFTGAETTEGKIAVNGDRATPVFSPYSGRVLRVAASPGDVVLKGTPLLEVEATEFAQGENDLMAATSALATAKSQLALAQTNEHRKQALYEAKAGSLQDWQQSQADLTTAQNNLRAAETAVALARNKLRILGKSEAQIDSLSPEHRLRPVAALLAPIGGTITDRQVGPGQYIQSGASNPVFVISDLSSVWLVANVREADAPLMRKGARVAVQVLALPGQTFEARLTYVGASIDPATRRLPVRAEVQNRDGLLKPEMFATFNIDARAASRAPGVPESAIVYEGDSARVWIVLEGGLLAARAVRTGRSSGGMVEIVSGLQAGEKVVTSGTLFIDRAASGE